MEYIADLHIHSRYSRATSRDSTLAGLNCWARVKGIDVVGTGDFTHPAWFSLLSRQLEPAEPGFFRLRDEPAESPVAGHTLPRRNVRFALSAEVSCIYKFGGRVRKVHNLIYVPDFESAAQLNRRLATIGNIASDGRPILGLDSRDLLEILLEAAPEGFLVPAHIWTPWFSLFGSRSGFDSVDECFRDLTPHIFALETGLSSDPAMNRMISKIDRYALISGSDCHSPAKLGREAIILDTEFDFFAMREAIKSNSRQRLKGTIEFFPEEGKYHADGHMNCSVRLVPSESRRLGGICPACGRPLTLGVHHRVTDLADRQSPLFPEEAPAVFSLIPLTEILGELLSTGPGSKSVMGAYAMALSLFGSELTLLLRTPADMIEKHSPLLAEAVRRMRNGEVTRDPGYDGRYGIIRVFGGTEFVPTGRQGSIFTR